MKSFKIENGMLKKYIGSAASVVIPDGVTSIGGFAFGADSHVTSVTIPNSVKRIADYAFCDCLKLTNISIPKSVTSIGAGAFFGCRGLADKDGFVIVRNCLYDYLGRAQVLVIPDSVTCISDIAFRRCYPLTSVTIPEGVKVIGRAAFLECKNLKNIMIPNSVTNIKDMAFSQCQNLTICSSEGSFAEHFAKIYSIPFKAV